MLIVTQAFSAYKIRYLRIETLVGSASAQEECSIGFVCRIPLPKLLPQDVQSIPSITTYNREKRA